LLLKVRLDGVQEKLDLICEGFGLP